MGAAAAEIAGKRRAYLLLGEMRGAVEERLCRHDHAAYAVAALRGLLLHEGALQRMRRRDGAEALDGRYLARAERPDRGDAGAHGTAVNQHRAGAALCKPAAELGAVELEIVAQHIEQWRIGLRGYAANCPIHLKADSHGFGLPVDRPDFVARRFPQSNALFRRAMPKYIFA